MVSTAFRRKAGGMIFHETKLSGAYVVEMQPFQDERGFFARGWCKHEFEDHGLKADLCQCNLSGNTKKYTLRGMHYQKPPYAETKFIRCIRGSVYDVIIDLRKNSETYLQWNGVELTAENRLGYYVPEGFAHGYITLEGNSEVLYLTTEFYSHEYEDAVRWNDPAFDIQWPVEDLNQLILSEKDRNHRDWDDSRAIVL